MKSIKIRAFMNAFILFLLTITLISCGVSQNPAAQNESSGNPLQENESTGYPATNGEKVEQSVTPDPSAGKVTGTLLYKGKPKVGTTLALANVISDSNGMEIATSFDRVNSPQITTQDDGSFVFYNVPPGRYGLIYADLPESYLLLRPGDPSLQEAVLITIDESSEVSLGVLDFDDLPGE